MTTDRNDHEASRSDFADELRPKTPLGDDVAAAGDLMNFVLDRTFETTDALSRYASLRFEEAPTSSQYAEELASIIVKDVKAWVRRWPR